MAGVKDNTLTSVKEGSIVNFKAIAQTPLKSLRVNFTPIQQGEGDPSPENIRAISGWTELDVYKAGKNLWNNEDLIYGYWTDSAGKESVNSKGCRTQNIYINPNTPLKLFYYGDQPYSASLIELDGNKNFIKRTHVGWNGTSNPNTLTVTTTSNTYYIYAQTYDDTTSKITYDKVSSYKIQLEFGSNITTYESFTDYKTVPVSWDSLGTVYGGYIDLISGEVWKTFWQYTFTGEQTFYTSGNWVVAYILPVDSYYPTAATPWQGVCSHYPYGPYGRGKIGVMYNERACTFDATIYDATGWKQYCADQYSAGTPVQIAYKLKNPQLIGTIDPITIKTLIRTNNIYSNADSVSVEYYDLESLNLYKQRFKANQPYLQTASGSVASFQTALKAPLKECKVYFEPVQEGSGDPSPENIRPISGWTGLEIYTAGKNLFGIHTNAYYPLFLRKGTNITASANKQIPIYYFTKDKVKIDFWTMRNLTDDGRYYKSFSLLDDAYYFKHESGSDDREMQIELGAAPTSYEDYQGATYPITFPASAGTVYGGYIDLVKGKIVAEWFSFKISECSVTLTSNDLTSWHNWKVFPPNIGKLITGLPISDLWIMCDRFIATPQSGGILSQNESRPIVWASAAEGNYRFKSQEYCNLSAAEFKQEFGDMQICGLVETPIEYDINPITIKTLKGINNIWSNANGNIQTKYWTYGNLAKRKTFTWNQWVPQLISENWQPQNADYSTLSIDNNIATINIIQDVTAVYLSSMKSKKIIPWILDHKYYIRQDINPSQDSEYVIIRFNSWVGGKRCLKDEWTTLKVVTTSTTTNSNIIYLGYCSVADQSTVGKITKIKNPMIVDLTQMFGSGNEPTLQEFESLCVRNGIDLTQYQPYDEGSTVNWYV